MLRGGALARGDVMGEAAEENRGVGPDSTVDINADRDEHRIVSPADVAVVGMFGEFGEGGGSASGRSALGEARRNIGIRNGDIQGDVTGIETVSAGDEEVDTEGRSA